MPRVAVVTGGTRGIGRAIAVRLNEAGYRVAANYGNDDDTARVFHNETGIPVFKFDVADFAACAEGVAAIEAQLGPIEVLVNNAGITRDNLIHKMTDDDWDAVAGVHLRGAFLCSRAAQREMVKRNWGRIVNLSSVSALGNRGQTNYSAAKAGLQGMAKTLAIELGRYGITANAVAPGFIDSEMTRATAIRLGRDPEEWKEERAREIPVRRAGTPRDVANLIAFLCSDEASFISGQAIYIAGGPRA